MYKKITTPHKLRLDWTALLPLSPLARKISNVQSGCSGNTFKVFRHLPGGIGMNFHTWAQALCASMEDERILVTKDPWDWMDKRYCSYVDDRPMLCYFGPHVSAGHCNSTTGYNKVSEAATHKWEACPSYMNKQHSVHEFMAAAMEYLFQSVQPVVIAEAQRQLQESFPDGLPNPEDMITVHMRWG